MGNRTDLRHKVKNPYNQQRSTGWFLVPDHCCQQPGLQHGEEEFIFLVSPQCSVGFPCTPSSEFSMLCYRKASVRVPECSGTRAFEYQNGMFGLVRDAIPFEYLNRVGFLKKNVHSSN